MTIFQTLFPPRIDSETVVEYWNVTLIQTKDGFYGCRVLYYSKPWSEAKKQLLWLVDVPSGIFGPQEPLIFTALDYCGSKGYLLRTRNQFDELCKEIPIKTIEEEVRLINNIKMAEIIGDQVRLLNQVIKIQEAQVGVYKKLIGALSAVNDHPKK